MDSCRMKWSQKARLMKVLPPLTDHKTDEVVTKSVADLVWAVTLRSIYYKVISNFASFSAEKLVQNVPVSFYVMVY